MSRTHRERDSPLRSERRLATHRTSFSGTIPGAEWMWQRGCEEWSSTFRSDCSPPPGERRGREKKEPPESSGLWFSGRFCTRPASKSFSVTRVAVVLNSSHLPSWRFSSLTERRDEKTFAQAPLHRSLMLLLRPRPESPSAANSKLWSPLGRNSSAPGGLLFAVSP